MGIDDMIAKGWKLRYKCDMSRFYLYRQFKDISVTIEYTPKCDYLMIANEQAVIRPPSSVAVEWQSLDKCNEIAELLFDTEFDKTVDRIEG